MKSLLNKRELNNEDGFTLIEILVVMAIMGILTAIAVPFFLGQRKAAVDTTLEMDMKSAAVHLETWSVNNYRLDPTQEVINDSKKSEGNTITLVSYSPVGGYVLCGKNPNGDQAAVGYTYRSASGGLSPEAC